MFKQKNSLIAVAVAVLLAACGGGGGSDTPSNTSPTDTQGGGNGGTNNPPATQTVTDKELAGQLELAQVIANYTSATQPGDVPLDDFEGTKPNTFGLYGQAQGASGSPLKNFGIKFLPPAEGSASGNGHIAIEVKNATSQFQVAIDQVNYKLDAATANRFEASAPKTAKAYVHVQNGAGTADVVVDNLPDGVVTVTSGYTDDPSYRGLLVDLDKLFAAAKTKVAGDAAKTATLNGVQTYDGQFNMNATFSAVNLVRAGQTTQYPGADITVSGQPVIKGAGVKGKIALGNFDPTKP
jgi:hypothetical protein